MVLHKHARRLLLDILLNLTAMTKLGQWRVRIIPRYLNIVIVSFSSSVDYERNSNLGILFTWNECKCQTFYIPSESSLCYLNCTSIIEGGSILRFLNVNQLNFFLSVCIWSKAEIACLFLGPNIAILEVRRSLGLLAIYTWHV